MSLPEAYDDVDEALLDDVLRHWAWAGAVAQRHAPVLRGLEEECQWLAERTAEDTKNRTIRAARILSEELEAKHQHDADFFHWSRRQYDRQDFEYLFFHRQRLDAKKREQLEKVAAKITYLNKDGSPGYFNKLEQNVGWTDYITPILFSGSRRVEKLVDCGLWVNAKNSGRCHYSDFCPCCLWNDFLKVLVAAFGIDSGAFLRARAWSFITCGFTTRKKNAKAIGRDLNVEDYHFMRGDHLYDPYPVLIGTDDDAIDLESFGWDDAKILGMVIQDALDDLFGAGHVHGYRHKLEAAFKISSGRARRLNMHGHAVANGDETNMQFIADFLYERVKAGLKKHTRLLNRHYHPDVLVLRISSPEDLHRCIVYSEKVVAVDRIFADVMHNPDATGEDGLPDKGFVEGVQESLRELIDEDMEAIFTAYNQASETQALRRRKAKGNMRFSDKPGACIGVEPKWHAEKRRKEAKAKREKRAAKRNADPDVAPIKCARKQKPRSRKIRGGPPRPGCGGFPVPHSTFMSIARRVALLLHPCTDQDDPTSAQA